MNNSNQTSAKDITLLHLAFRPFFIAAAVFAIVAMLIWLFSFNYNINFLPKAPYPALIWHAHEMIFGYALAVIAGFLLTAIKNWTKLQTINGMPLLGLLLLWIVARICIILGYSIPLLSTAIIDNAFILFLIIASMIPIIKVKQWRQIGIIAKLWLLLASNIVFYLGVGGVINNGINIGIYSGLILMLGLVLTIFRRVFPFFMKQALTHEVWNNKVIDRASITGFFIFWIAYSYNQTSKLSMLIAAALFVIHAIRLMGYYSNGIWKQSLLWSMFVSYACIILGFAFVVLAYFSPTPPFIAVHAFGIGGIGIITLSMMARVSLGHTARNVYQPPNTVKYMLFLICLCAIFRVVFPLFDMGNYKLWVLLAQLLWILVFGLFLFTYLPLLLYRRFDGDDG